MHKQGFYEKYIKRLMDIAISLVALIILSPLFLCITVLVKINLGSPVLFRQKRPGLDEKIFVIYKYRTMTDKRDKDGMMLMDEMRLTKFGKFLRASSLDELPELINILKGDMSIVGPRPLLVEYLPRYNEQQKKRHGVRPGLTGYAQVNGRNAITWEKKFELDVWYVEHINFMLDLLILIKTVQKVLSREGISSQNNATMEEFKG